MVRYLQTLPANRTTSLSPPVTTIFPFLAKAPWKSSCEWKRFCEPPWLPRSSLPISQAYDVQTTLAVGSPFSTPSHFHLSKTLFPFHKIGMATTCRPSGPSLNYKSSLPSSLLILFLSFVPLVFHRPFALGTPVSIDTLASIDSLPSVNSPVLRWHLVSVNTLVLPQHSRPHRQSRLPALSPCQCFCL